MRKAFHRTSQLRMSTRITRSSSRKSLDDVPGAPSQVTTVPSKSKAKPKLSKTLVKDQKKGASKQDVSILSAKHTMAPPATPPPKRVKKNGGVTAPLTNIVGLHTSGDVDDALPSTPAIERPAEPHVTNAPLITPGGSKLVAYTRETADVSPSKTGVPRATTTTGSLLQDACNHLLKIDGRLEQLIQKHYCQMFSPEGLAEPLDPFRTLCTGIMSQQVSGAAAAAIEKKFIRLFNEEPLEGEEETWGFPSPAVVAASDVTFLRQAGLSQRKAEYIQGLAERFASGELSAKILIDASYEELVQKLTAVRGLGLWSVEMFACFNLKRMDVFSTGDLGVQRGMAAFVGRDVNKLKAKGGGKWKYMNEKEMLEIAAPFAPYRSLFMWYMWRVADVNVDAIQNKR